MSRATALLGVSHEPTLEEVKTAYHQLAQLHHPDVGGDPERFKQLHEAYLQAMEEVEDRPCENCKGSGKVVVQMGWTTQKVQCPDCGGSGYPNG